MTHKKVELPMGIINVKKHPSTVDIRTAVNFACAHVGMVASPASTTEHHHYMWILDGVHFVCGQTEGALGTEVTFGLCKCEIYPRVSQPLPECGDFCICGTMLLASLSRWFSMYAPARSPSLTLSLSLSLVHIERASSDTHNKKDGYTLNSSEQCV